MGDELLYESRHSRVSRVVGPDDSTTLIRKQSLGPDAVRRAQHELGILRRLAGVPGVPGVADGIDRPDILLLEDTGGESLEGTLSGGPLDADEILGFAFDIVETVAAVHRRGVIHKDISPANILVHGTHARPVLIDFGLSSTFAEERPGFTHHRDIVGTPAYIAPEQTGRTGWAVDQRADLYGLGATLYELATGSPPFGDGDLLRLVHDHLTRVPIPACEMNPKVPPMLSAIIGHLLEKEPDRRYQSAEGVLHDLSRFRAERVRGVSVSFTPGERDFPWRLAPPSRLVGRGPEIDVLASTFAEAAAGRCRGVFISGQPGVGKTALVDELRPLAAAGGGWFLTGKFDQYRRDAGSDALQQMARAMARMWLAEPESELAALRVKLCAALGTSAGLLVAAVPEMRPVLGVMESPAADPLHAQGQLRQAGLELLAAVASTARPIVIFLDDLQWAGNASVAFIDAVLAADRLKGVLLVGAYRESEVDAGHPLAGVLSIWGPRGDRLRQLRLGNLAPPDLRVLLGEMLRMQPAGTATLAEVIGARTDGNPFDTVELINALRRDGALVPGVDGWAWDPISLYRYLGPSDVVELLTARISTLAEPTRELLEIMACLGGEVELDMLRAACGIPAVEPAGVGGRMPGPAPRGSGPPGTGRPGGFVPTVPGAGHAASTVPGAERAGPAADPGQPGSVGGAGAGSGSGSVGGAGAGSGSGSVGGAGAGSGSGPAVGSGAGPGPGLVAGLPGVTAVGGELPGVRGAPLSLGGCEPALPSDLHVRLAPALEEGLLVMEHGRATSVRFRHDRVQQAAYGSMTPDARRARHLTLARRLAAPSFRVVAQPGYRVAAAEQYLPAFTELTDPVERHRVMSLFRAAAGDARSVGNHTLVERYLATAAQLLDEDPTDPADVRLRHELEIEWHAALNVLGRFDEVDALFERIVRTNDSALDRARAAWVQVSSQLNRGQPKAGLDVGMWALADLGHPVPTAEELPAVIDRGLDRLKTSAARGDESEYLRRTVNGDPRLAAVAKIINWMIPAAYFCLDPVMPWLVTEAERLWNEVGLTQTLVGPLAHTSFVTIAERQDYATGYAFVRKVLAASEYRGYEPDTSQARFLFSVSAAPWFEPLEETTRQAKLARDGLVRGGDLTYACFTYFATTPQLIDCASTMDEVLADARSGYDMARRTGNETMAAALVAHLRTIWSLRGGLATSDASAEDLPLDDDRFDEAAHLTDAGSNPNSAATYHLARGLTAAILGDLETANRHVAEAWEILPFVEGTQCVTWAHVLRAVGRADEIRRAAPRQWDAPLVQLDESRGWLARRAAEAPANFLHLRCLVDAERAWALGDTTGALDAFEQARRAVAVLQRPWQQGMIAERFALLHMARGAEESGRMALREARRIFRAWGASRKVERLDREHPFLREDDSPWSDAEARRAVDARRSANVSADAVDMLAVLRASQALSSETNLAGLQARVREVLGALTGATSVQMFLRSGDGWILPQSESTGGSAIGVAEAATRGMLPMSVFRYVERTQEPLLVEDAARDDRFSRDPYLRELRECSLMVVPILIRGELSAMLVLENQCSRTALNANRLDTVLLIAGQLSVSLDNALLYAELEYKVAQRTEALREANDRLEQLAVTDPLTGLANRRRLTEVLETEWRRSIRMHTPIAIAMIDIDHFKLYNDHYGHPAGDECLRKVASVIGGVVRESDLPARYGGEEFAIVLPYTDEKMACTVAERVREAVVDLAEPHARAAHRIVTVSVGVAATTPTRLDQTEQLVKTADAELYRAKRGGRNRVSGGATAR